jgi:hypothetical protein
MTSQKRFDLVHSPKSVPLSDHHLVALPGYNVGNRGGFVEYFHFL